MRETVILGERACSGRGVALVEIQQPCDIVKQRMPRRSVLSRQFMDSTTKAKYT